MTEGKTYRKWIIFDGCSGSPKLQGPDIAYADNPEVVDIQAVTDANERIKELEAETVHLHNALEGVCQKLATAKQALELVLAKEKEGYLSFCGINKTKTVVQQALKEIEGKK